MIQEPPGDFTWCDLWTHFEIRWPGLFRAFQAEAVRVGG